MIDTGEFFVMLDKDNDKKVIEMMREIEVYKTKEVRAVCRTTTINKYKIIRSHIYVDFRYDAVIKDKKIRQLIISLLKKSSKKVCYMRRVDKYKDSVCFLVIAEGIIFMIRK